MARKRKKQQSVLEKIKAGLAILLRKVTRLLIVIAVMMLMFIGIYTQINPPITAYIYTERERLASVRREWRDLENISPYMARSIVAAEDSNFCNHWGFDMSQIRNALAEGGGRGASTITQQTVKNVFLWHGRSWARKALEALITPFVELLWSKKRILEVYMNVAEFDEGVFGVAAASRWYFGVDAANLTPEQAAQLAAILPDPKGRSATNPSEYMLERVPVIMSGAATIRADGRSACFEG